MKAKITQAFKFAIDGLKVVDVNVGDVVDGRRAEIALKEGWGAHFTEAAPEAAAAIVEPEAAPPPAASNTVQVVPVGPPPAFKPKSKNKGR